MSRTISISKTKKMTARRKNRREKGIRALPRGSNPHSNGDAFSRSMVDRWFRAKEIINTISGTIRAIAYKIREVFI